MNYRKFKKTTKLRSIATPASVRVIKNLENAYRRVGRKLTVVKHRSKYSTVCHIGLQKTGSVWFREMFADNSVYKYSGLDFVDCAGKGSEINVSSGLYSPIRKPFEVVSLNPALDNIAVVLVIRHPISMILSWIKSTKGYHISGASDQGLAIRRDELNELSTDEQVRYAADFFESTSRFRNFEKLLEMHSGRENSMILKYEECVYNADDTFSNIFSWLDIAMPAAKQQSFVQKHSFESYSGRSIESAAKSNESAMQGTSYLELNLFSEDIKKYALSKVGDLLKIQYGLT